MLLIGAYQETLGDLHNLFGEVSEVNVTVTPEGEVRTEDLQRGDSVRDVLRYTGHDPDELRDAIELQLAKRLEEGLITAEEQRDFMATTSMTLDDYTYLV